MGNCQAIDAATLAIQHPNGKEDKLYWPVAASEIMKSNPGHYVALLITSSLRPPGRRAHDHNSASQGDENTKTGLVRVTCLKILRPTDTLVVGQVYRLITAQEVMQGLRAKKQAKMKKNKPEPAQEQEEKAEPELDSAALRSEMNKTDQVMKPGRNRPRTVNSAPNSTASNRARSWQPSLQSISEAGS